MREFIKRAKNRYLLCSYLCLCVMTQLSPMIVSASSAGVEAINQSFGNFLDMIMAFVSSIGSIFVLWGIFEFGTSLQSPNGSEQAQAFRRIGGGLLMTLGPALITGF